MKARRPAQPASTHMPETVSGACAVGGHVTVLLHEAVDALLGGPEPVPARPRQWVDATFGRGGHSRLLLSRMGAKDRLLAFDRDPQAVQAAVALREADPRFSIRHAPFAQMDDLPAASVDGLLMDLGISSAQIDTPQRGFSLRFDGPLDMRMDPTHGQSVAQWLAVAAVGEIASVIREYGEERFAPQIARAIVTHREKYGSVQGTAELAALVAAVVRTREGSQHPATRTFQALRIFINGELNELRTALRASLRLLRPGGRLAVISFHSLEDRIVKQFIAAHASDAYDRRNPLAPPTPLLLQSVARIRPTAAEVAANARARSAILRVAQRTDQPLFVEDASC